MSVDRAASVENLAHAILNAPDVKVVYTDAVHEPHPAVWLAQHLTAWEANRPAVSPFTGEQLVEVLRDMGVRRVNMEPWGARVGKILSREAFAELLLPRLGLPPSAPPPTGFLNMLTATQLEAAIEAGAQAIYDEFNKRHGGVLSWEGLAPGVKRSYREAMALALRAVRDALNRLAARASSGEAAS